MVLPLLFLCVCFDVCCLCCVDCLSLCTIVIKHGLMYLCVFVLRWGLFIVCVCLCFFVFCVV